MSKPLLIIGNKNYSSWSLRAWLMLKHAGVAGSRQATKDNQTGKNVKKKLTKLKNKKNNKKVCQNKTKNKQFLIKKSKK